MTKYVFQQSAFSADEAVSVAPYASFTFTDSATGDPADLWEDDAGLVPITGNVVLADEYGYVRAYLTAGFYDVAIVAGSLTKTLVDVSIGGTAVADVALLDGRVTTLETTVSQQPVNDTLAVRTVSAPGTTTLGVTPNAGFIRVSVGAASESFNIVAATGKVARVLVAPSIDYSPTGGDIFTLNGANFDATASGLVFEVFDDDTGFNTWMRLQKQATGGALLTITLADGVTNNVVAHCTHSTCYLDNAGLTGALASWYPSGTQYALYSQLHDVVKFTLQNGSAYGITDLDGQGWGLAPGESALHYRNGVWLKV